MLKLITQHDFQREPSNWGPVKFRSSPPMPTTSSCLRLSHVRPKASLFISHCMKIELPNVPERPKNFSIFRLSLFPQRVVEIASVILTFSWLALRQRWRSGSGASGGWLEPDPMEVKIFILWVCGTVSMNIQCIQKCSDHFQFSIFWYVSDSL